MRRPNPRLEWVRHAPVLVWADSRPWLAISSAPHGGGVGERFWVANASVAGGYERQDPDQHLAEIAREIGLRGPGAAMLTAVDVRSAATRGDGGVLVNVTTGIDHPVWPADETALARAQRAGTVNAVCWLPVRLTGAALVNTVATVAEAKAQALVTAGVPGTGTATDSTVVLCPAGGSAEPFGGPRSRIGAALARSVHGAVLAGLRTNHPQHRRR